MCLLLQTSEDLLDMTEEKSIFLVDDPNLEDEMTEFDISRQTSSSSRPIPSAPSKKGKWTLVIFFK